MSFFSANIARLHSPAMVKHFNYISREENYKKMKDLLYSESGNLPKWAKTGKDYWETTKAQEDQVNADFKEGKRGEKNCSVRKYRFALPNEMTDKQMIEFTKEYLEENFKDLPYTFAIHKKTSTVHEKENPHVHLIFADRVNNERSANLDKENYYKMHGVSKAGKEYGGAYRTRDYSAKNPRVYRQTRKNLADRINAFYKKHGIDKKVTEKSLKAERKEALSEGDILTAESLNRPKPFRLSAAKFKKNQKIIQEKIKMGWRNVKDLDDVPDPEVRERIIQEFEKEIKEESLNEVKSSLLEPNEIDKLHAIENKINELKMLKKFSPTRSGISNILNEMELEQLEKEKEKLKENSSGKGNYYLTKKYEAALNDIIYKKQIKGLMEASIAEKIKECAIAVYSIQEMEQRINELKKKKENTLLFNHADKISNGECRQLLRKLDSRKSLKKYYLREGKDPDLIDQQIKEIEKKINVLIAKNVSSEEKERIHNEYESVQKEIFELTEVSTSYESRLEATGIDKAFKEKHSAAIQEYLQSLKRLNRYNVSEKERPSDSMYEDLLNDAILKKAESFERLLQEEQDKNWEHSLSEVIDKMTDGSLHKLKNEQYDLLQEKESISSYDYRKVYAIRERVKEIEHLINQLVKEKMPECEKKAKKILRESRKDRLLRVNELISLKKRLEKDLKRKYLHPEIADRLKKILKNADEKIDAIRLRRSGSRFEESRLKWIEETVKNRQKNFYKEYQKLIPQTEKALVEKLIDNESGMQLSKLKEQLRSQESFRKYTIKQGKDPIFYDKKIETLKEKMEFIRKQYRTPELLLKARKLSQFTRKKWKENRRLAKKMEQQILKDAQRRNISSELKQSCKKALSYAKYQLSKQKLLNDTVTLRVIAFKDKVMAEIPRREEFYFKQIINEKTNNNLQKVEALLYHYEKSKKNEDYSAVTMKEIDLKIKELASKRSKIISEQKTPEILKEVMLRKEKALLEYADKIKDLRKEFKFIQKDAQRRHLSPNTRIFVEKNAKELEKLLFHSESVVLNHKNRHSSLHTSDPFKSLKTVRLPSMLKRLQGIGKIKNSSIHGRANIRIYKHEDDFER